MQSWLMTINHHPYAVLADLYLGKTWLCGLPGGWAPGVAWLAILGGAYALWHVGDDVHPKGLAAVVIGSLAVVGLRTVPASSQTERLSSVSAFQPAYLRTSGNSTDVAVPPVPAESAAISNEDQVESVS